MLAIAGGKGGCGKTTTTVGLARALAGRGPRPLVVDADRAMPDLHHRVGIDRQPGVDSLVDEPPADVAQHPPAFPCVEAIPCGTSDPAALAAGLERLRGQRRPVLVDCPAGAGPDAAVPLRRADASVVVATPTERSLRDGAKTAAMARELGADPVLTVLTRSDGRLDPEATLGCPRTVHVPEVSEPPLEAKGAAVRYADAAERLRERNI